MPKPSPNMSKPPEGIIPRHLWIENRLADIENAIQRRIETTHIIPVDWVQERNDLMQLLKEHLLKGKDEPLYKSLEE
jgi:hypothetical protein